MGKLILAIALFMGDAALLVLIVVSAATGWKFSFLGPTILTPPEPPPGVASEEIADADPGESANAGNDISEPQNSQNSDTDEQEQAPPGESSTSIFDEEEVALSDEISVADIEQGSNASKYPSASSMTTSANATENDIKNYSWENGWSTMSPQAERMHSFDAVTGGWRAVMITDPLELLDCYSTDNMNIEISGSPDSATITFNSNKRRFHRTGEVLNLSGEHPSFKGVFTGGSITATSQSGAIKLEHFYIDGNTEYALGTYTFPSGEIAYIGMVRP